jgi:predicted DNA-binding transcriptional regulator AlpA
MTRELLTPKDVANLLQVSIKQVRRLMLRGMLPQPVVLGHRTIRYRAADLQHLIRPAQPLAS